MSRALLFVFVAASALVASAQHEWQVGNSAPCLGMNTRVDFDVVVLEHKPTGSFVTNDYKLQITSNKASKYRSLTKEQTGRGDWVQVGARRNGIRGTLTAGGGGLKGKLLTPKEAYFFCCNMADTFVVCADQPDSNYFFAEGQPTNKVKVGDAVAIVPASTLKSDDRFVRNPLQKQDQAVGMPASMFKKMNSAADSTNKKVDAAAAAPAAPAPDADSDVKGSKKSTESSDADSDVKGTKKNTDDAGKDSTAAAADDEDSSAPTDRVWQVGNPGPCLGQNKREDFPVTLVIGTAEGTMGEDSFKITVTEIQTTTFKGLAKADAGSGDWTQVLAARNSFRGTKKASSSVLDAVLQPKEAHAFCCNFVTTKEAGAQAHVACSDQPGVSYFSAKKVHKGDRISIKAAFLTKAGDRFVRSKKQ